MLPSIAQRNVAQITVFFLLATWLFPALTQEKQLDRKAINTILQMFRNPSLLREVETTKEQSDAIKASSQAD